jgi:hypothetical protein
MHISPVEGVVGQNTDVIVKVRLAIERYQYVHVYFEIVLMFSI